MHVPELVRMGADIQIEGRIAFVRESCHFARTCRGGRFTGLCRPCLAALATRGQSVIGDIYHLDRGYADLTAKLSLGAVLQRLD